ncbi:MAG: hypothetical protein U0X20_31590 [Caldilineaceae bacterium]
MSKQLTAGQAADLVDWLASCGYVLCKVRTRWRAEMLRSDDLGQQLMLNAGTDRCWHCRYQKTWAG